MRLVAASLLFLVGSALGGWQDYVGSLEELSMTELVPRGPGVPENEYSRGPIWNVTYYDCSNKTNRDYTHPEDCTRFIKCRDGIANDFPCCDCLPDRYAQCDGEQYQFFDEHNGEWCRWPIDVDCPNKDPVTTTRPDDSDDSLCAADVNHGGPCVVETEKDCKCGTCLHNQGVFQYFWCNISTPEDPNAQQGPGVWVEERCSGNDLWNPEAGTNGQCWSNWHSLPEKYQDEYKEIPCWGNKECVDNDHGSICATSPVEGAECDLSSVRCSCGECERNTTSFWHFECVPQRPAEDPRDPWVGKWVKTTCGDRQVYNPTTMSCTSWEELRDGGIKDTYLQDCFDHPVCEEEGEVCPEDKIPVRGEPCNPNPEKCRCGRCIEDGAFEHYFCDFHQPANPFDPWTGTWEGGDCGEKEFYNPSTGKCTSDWDELDEDTKSEYMQPPCFKPPKCENKDAEFTPGGDICDRNVVHGASCQPDDAPCNCGRCVEDLQFEYFHCEAHPPVGNPWGGWTGNWTHNSCGEKEFYNPDTGRCTEDWKSLPHHAQKLYKESPCLKVPECPRTPTSGEICAPEVKEGDSCDPDAKGSHCNCGRCTGNATFAFFDCVPVLPEDNPHVGWSGVRVGGNCPTDPSREFYNPDTGACVASWFHLPKPVREEYKKDKECILVPCEEGQEEKWECSNVYYTLFDEDYNVRTCPNDRFYDMATRGCRPCGEVDGCHDCRTCTVDNNHKVSCPQK